MATGSARPARRVLITGSRNWTDQQAVRDTLVTHMRKGDTLVSGACPTGADALCEQFWAPYGPVERHPADWSTHGRAAGPLRNQAMVDTAPDLVLAFPLGDSRGTWDCVRRARTAGLAVIVTEPSNSRTV